MENPVVLAEIVENNKNFRWVYQPILVWFIFIGIKLHPKQISHFKKLFKLFSVSMVLFNLFTYSATIFLVAKNFGRSSKGLTMSWNVVIDNFNDVLFTCGIHVALYFKTTLSQSWLKLWESFENVEHYFHFEEFKTFRKYIFLTLFGILLKTVFNIAMSVDTYFHLDGPDFWFPFLAFLWKTFPNSSLYFFAGMAWIISIMFDILGTRLRELTEVRALNSLPHTETKFLHKELAILIRLHAYLCDIIHNFNQNFGWIVLIGIIYSFIGFIASLFWVIFRIENGNLHFAAVAFFLDHVALTVVLIIFPHNIYQKVLRVKRSLYKLDHGDPSLQRLLLQFSKNVHDFKPRITGMDFFKLSLELYPKLIGATITYLVILCQFQSAETA